MGGGWTDVEGIGYRSTPKDETYQSVCSNDNLCIEIDGPWWQNIHLRVNFHCSMPPSFKTRSGLPQVSALSLRSRSNNYQTRLTCSPKDRAGAGSSGPKNGESTTLAVLEYFSIMFCHVSCLSSGVQPLADSGKSHQANLTKKDSELLERADKTTW